ncbi:16S rRNA m(7)G-527 methyltransferase [Actinomyces ruminicola]|uniref:Ribosomal RNA small subunit methyltransferase G n=1 Tax=Actinomyces ruminicola TaxID=332524 RepID=A0A1H0AQ29_9ACTO|nr:16S rRNA (guanine(527)-N(7))-methyltransferase RsmG [Actinomyces ruminicola]SDN35501.1 16S rRNA m(7)G-527 methyltransferase [Actinomyces ruminicola]
MSTPITPDAAGAEVDPAQLEEPTAQVRAMFGPAFSATEHFAQMLAEQGELRGLVGPRELPRLWSRHIVNSAAVVPFLPASGRVADIGSGAGFPGIVVALLRPDLDVVLVESMERRTQWLEDVVAELDLDNVAIERARAEELRAKYDAVTARAVANLTKLIRMTSPLLKPGASLLALKGARADAEVAEAKYVIKRARLEPAVIHEVITPDEGVTKVVEVRRPASR